MVMAAATAARSRLRGRLLDLNGHIVGEQGVMPTTPKHRV